MPPPPPPDPEPLTLDLADFDAVGVMSDVVLAVRSHAISSGADAVAFVSAPEGWHQVAVTGRRSGHLVLSVRYTELTPSRRHNVARALARREWQLDDDGDGATVRFPPGTDASAPAFEVLAVLTLAGAPKDVRRVRALDAAGEPLALP
jgi:hypothetical protein